MTSTLYRSGSVHAPGTPRATSLLVDSETGRVVWIGTDEASARLGDPDEEVDLDGRLMVPAFVDAWAHDGAEATLEAAATQGFGALHVLTAPGAGALTQSSAPRVVRYEAVDADGLDVAALIERYDQRTEAGEQAAVVVGDAAAARRAVAAAGAVADRVGLLRFVAARHRLHVGDGLPVDIVPDLARLGLVVCLATTASGDRHGHDRPLRALAAAGVAFAFGSVGGVMDAWRWVRDASSGGEQAISARAAFTAATRGGHRAAAADGLGLLRPGAPATFAVWEFEGELVVRGPDARVAAWSTDPRAATPGLPDLAHGPAPRCRRTVVDGRTVFDDGTLA